VVGDTSSACLEPGTVASFAGLSAYRVFRCPLDHAGSLKRLGMVNIFAAGLAHVGADMGDTRLARLILCA
jgi:hypothetical protein